MCPRRYTWSHVVTREKVANPFKDTQYLVRGNSIQALIDLWCRSNLWSHGESLETCVAIFLSETVRKVVSQEWISDQYRGTPGIDQWDLAFEVEKTMRLALPDLQRHWIALAGGPGFRLETETEEKAVWGDGQVCVSARLDAVLWHSTDHYKATIYEGKSTRYPERTADTQLRWQIEIMRETYPVGVTVTHYYFFYTTREFREVTLGREHEEWILQRDLKIKELLSGAEEPTPSAYACKFCPHRRQCPARHKAKSRVKPALDPPSRGKKINVV